jgi:hypothetical protein
MAYPAPSPASGIFIPVTSNTSSGEENSASLSASFPESFHSHIEVCDFLRELPLNRSFLDLADARIQRFFQAVNPFQEFQLFRNNACALQDGITTLKCSGVAK